MENVKFDKLNLTQNLVNGIEERNKGNYQNAIDLFEYCKSIDVTDLRIYENIYKVDFFRKDYDLAFRNLMIILHNQILVDSVRNHPIGEVVFNQELRSFTTQNKQLFDNYLFEPELILKVIRENSILQNIIFVGNSVTYRIGHAYVGKYLNTNILNEFENKVELFENYNFRITDRERGASFFTQNYKGYFVCIGFIYAHMNLNFNLKNINEIIQYYLGSEFEIKSNIWDYNKFLMRQP